MPGTALYTIVFFAWLVGAAGVRPRPAPDEQPRHGPRAATSCRRRA